ncbi:MAG: hypothetical protein H6510_03425 [Acidobacteria bacterium]|nr:hypothetical protein [Acidobacteriota bacterium]
MLNKTQLESWFQLSVEAATRATARILQHYQGEYEVYKKDIGTHTGDIVTEADHDAQALILEVLYTAADELREQTAIVAEEMTDHHPDDRYRKPYVFLIDPLDGTRGFVDRTNSFAVSIGLVEQDGTPVFGVVSLPAIGRFYTGWAKEKSSCNGIALNPPQIGSELVLWVSEAEIYPQEKNPLWHALTADLKAQLGIKKCRPTVLASPVHKGCNLLTGDAGLYLGLPRRNKGVSLWDLAGVAAVIQGAGGWVSDVAGQPLELNRRESVYCHHKGFVMASNPEVGKATVDFLQNRYPDHIFDS